MNRRKSLHTLGLLTGLSITGPIASAAPKKSKSKFAYCLNTSTISGQKPGLKKSIEIAAQAGYDHVEVWIRDVKAYKDEGNSLSALKKFMDDSNISVANTIGFAPWMVNDEEERKAGFKQMEEEMNMMAELGCTRIAAPPAGVRAEQPVDLFDAGERLKQLIDLGRKTGVMPQLEFWGAHPNFYTLGQVLMVAAVADDTDVKILPDIYHLFRGGSGFDSLKMVSGDILDIMHINDYPGDIPREQQADKDRLYPGDGVAPVSDVLKYLAAMSGPKILSLELFNQEYWKQDALTVAKTGIQKMKDSVKAAGLA